METVPYLKYICKILLRKYILPGLLALFFSITALTGQGNNKIQTFSPGEQIRYKAYYNWGFIWLLAGDVSFSVKASGNNEENFHFRAEGRTRKKYNWFFKVRDKFESEASASSLEPITYLRETYEGGYYVNNYYRFDYTKNKIYSQTENSKKPYSKDTLDLKKGTMDVLTAIYYCRNLKFSNFRMNDTVPLRMIIDNKIYDLYIRYLGHEKISLRNKNLYNCFKFSILLVEGTIFKGGEDLFVWVTDDQFRVPVLVESKILVGSVKAMIEDYKIQPDLKSSQF
jgi:hypothetical protein